MTRHLVMLALIIAAVLPARPATLVVDNQHPQAADTNPGTPEQPFKTIAAAAAKAVADDTVLVRPGLYRESVTLTTGGEPGKPITFRSEKPEQAVLCGSDVIAQWQPAGLGVWVTDVPDLRENPWALPHRDKGGQWVYINGCPLQYADSREQLTPETFALDLKGKKLYVAPAEGQDIAKLTVEYARRDGLFWPKEPLNDIQITGFRLRHNADWFRGRSAITVSGQRWLVEGNHIEWGSYLGLQMRNSNHCTVRGNVVEWCGDMGMGGGPNIGLLVEGNRILYNNWRRINPSFEGGGSKWTSTMESYLRDNEFAYNHGSGLWCDGFNCNNFHDHNTCHDNSIWGMFSEINWDETFRENVSYNNAEGIVIAETPGGVATRNICFNNDYGVRYRSHYHRALGDAHDPKSIAEQRTRIAAIPGIEPAAVDRWVTAWTKYLIAPDFFMGNNGFVFENLLFNNEAAIQEHRDYKAPLPEDPYITNWSDYNLFWFRQTAVPGWAAPVLIQNRNGGVSDLAEWQQISGRDRHSVMVDPLQPDAQLPEWAASRRKEWALPLRPRPEIRTLGLVQGPATCLAWGRWLRSPTSEPFPLSDPQIKAYWLQVDGEKTLMLWTTHEQSRRYLRLALTQERVTIERDYLSRQERPVPNGSLDLTVTCLPTYLRGVTGEVQETPGVTLNVRPFNPPDKPVAVTAAVPNTAATALPLEISFTVSPGFAVKPAQIRQTVPAGSTSQVAAEIIPDANLRRGPGTLRMDVTLGQERLARLAGFSVGEAGGTVPKAPGAIKMDGNSDDWKGLLDGPPVALVTAADQCANGDSKAWSGPTDLSAKLYCAWTPQALYALVLVTDDKLVALPAPVAPWDGDSIELFVDGRSGEMQWQQAPTEGCYQIGVAPTPGGPNVKVFSAGQDRPLPGLQVATATAADGYVVEMLVPLSQRTFPAGAWDAGRPLKLSLLVNDKDDPAAAMREATFGWAFSPKGANYNDTSGWKTLVLQ